MWTHKLQVYSHELCSHHPKLQQFTSSQEILEQCNPYYLRPKMPLYTFTFGQLDKLFQISTLFFPKQELAGPCLLSLMATYSIWMHFNISILKILIFWGAMVLTHSHLYWTFPLLTCFGRILSWYSSSLFYLYLSYSIFMTCTSFHKLTDLVKY